MQINSIKFKNFNSYGNDLIELEFDKKSSLNLLKGLNGSGKSTISNILCFGLYGKVAGKNKTDLPNRTNKNLYVEIDLFSKNKRVVIKRGIQPNIFEIIVDGEEKDEGKIGNMQSYLDDDILQIPFSVFNNMLVLSINDFKSFLTMTPSQKKSIIDKIFGFGVLNSIKEHVKDEKREIKKSIDDITSSIETLKITLKDIDEKIENQNQFNFDKKLEYEQNKTEIEIDLVDKKEKLKVLTEHLNKFKKEKKKFSEETVINNTVLKTLKSTLDVYNKGKCPLCLNNLDHNHDIYETVQNEYIETNELLISLNSDIDKLNKNITKCNNFIKELNNEIIKNNSQVSIYENKIEELQQKEKSDLNQLQEDILKQLVDKKNLLNDLMIEDNFLFQFLEFVGDDGIKKMALATVIPSLNEQIVKMCNEMHLNYIVQFDATFDSQIYTSKKEEVSPKSLSTGQRKVIDFICVISLLKVLKIRFPSINILFLDEIFSSIDSDRIYEITKALRKLTEEMNLHVFVVNHADLPSEYFDMIYETKIENGFSIINKSET